MKRFNMNKTICTIKHRSRWEGQNKRICDEFVFLDLKLLFRPKLMMLGINPSAGMDVFCDQTNLKLINALIQYNKGNKGREFKGYKLVNFSSVVSSQMKSLSIGDYDLNIEILEKWLKKGRCICLFYGRDFVTGTSVSVAIKNKIFSSRFIQLIKKYKTQIYVTTFDGKFSHPSRLSGVKIEQYNSQYTVFIDP